MYHNWWIKDYKKDQNMNKVMAYVLQVWSLDNAFQIVNHICFGYITAVVLCIQLIPLPPDTQQHLYDCIFVLAITSFFNLIFEVVYQACRHQWNQGSHNWE